MQRWILHIDMDAFFASVEQMDNPELRGLPVAVGGRSDRGVVSAASYEARKFGVRSAMSVVKARQLCPQLVLIPGRMSRYKEISEKVMATLGDFSPVVEQASVDEAYLEATGLERLFGPIDQICRAIRQRVRENTGLTCSVGAAPIRFLAKIASDMNKPNGMYIIFPEDMHDFLRDLPVGRIPGVGKRTLDGLTRLGVRTAGDILAQAREFWETRLGKYGGVLHDRASGVDPNGVEPYTGMKSSSAENTFEEDTSDRELLKRWLLLQSDRVASDLRRHGVKGRTVTLKVKFADFQSVTRSHSLDYSTNETDAIYRTACGLLDGLHLRTKVRLIGVGMSNFKDKPKQLSLLSAPPTAGENPLDKAVDAIRGKFGSTLLQRADVLDFKGKKPQ